MAYKKRYYNKFKNKITYRFGLKFASEGEAHRYGDLRRLRDDGAIEHLSTQPPLLLQESFRHEGKTERAIHYVADFRYYDNDEGCWVIEDYKGVRTAVFNLKRKWFLKRNREGKYDQFYKFLLTDKSWLSEY